MTCERCGSPCQGRRCQACEMQAANTTLHGTPSDHDADQDDEWTVEQQGIDGGPRGQATLDGGITDVDGGDDS